MAERTLWLSATETHSLQREFMDPPLRSQAIWNIHDRHEMWLSGSHDQKKFGGKYRQNEDMIKELEKYGLFFSSTT